RYHRRCRLVLVLTDSHGLAIGSLEGPRAERRGPFFFDMILQQYHRQGAKNAEDDIFEDQVRL
ncbi:MAG: hypothetical protein ACE15F_18375, partial [bacterium]